MSFLLDFFFFNSQKAAKPVIEHPHLEQNTQPEIVGARRELAQTNTGFTPEKLGFGKGFISVRSRVEEIEEGFTEVVHVNSDKMSYPEYKELQRIRTITKIYERNAGYILENVELAKKHADYLSYLYAQALEKVTRLEEIYSAVNKTPKVMSVFKRVVGELAEKDVAELTYDDFETLEKGVKMGKQALRNEVKLKLALANPMTHGLLTAGVLATKLDANEKLNLEVREDDDKRAHFEFEELEDEYDAALENPLDDLPDDPIAQRFQAQYTEKERVEMADRLLSSKPKSKTLEEMREEVVARKTLRAKALNRERKTRAERQELIALSNPFTKGLVEGDVIERDYGSRSGYKLGSNPNARGSVPPSDLLEEAFAELDAE